MWQSLPFLKIAFGYMSPEKLIMQCYQNFEQYEKTVIASLSQNIGFVQYSVVLM